EARWILWRPHGVSLVWCPAGSQSTGMRNDHDKDHALRIESTFRAIQSSPGVLGCPGVLRNCARGEALAGRRRAVLKCRPAAHHRFSEATGEGARTDDPMRNPSAQCSGLYAGHARLVAPAAISRDVLQWFQRWAHAERQSVSAAAARVQGVRFRAVA